MLPSDPFGRDVRVPTDYSTEGRVRLIGEFVEALMRGDMPSDEARLFTVAGMSTWLSGGGDLLRECWRVVTPRSHRTAARIWQELSEPHPDERQDGADPQDCSST